MALTACKDCNAEISADAKTCPNCGAQNAAAFTAARISGLIYLGLVGLAFYWVLGLMSPEARSQSTIGYTITNDEHRAGRPRKVKVTLPRRLTEAELLEVSEVVRNDTMASADMTFISFIVEGQTDSGYWAITSFQPDYKHNLIGLSAEDYQRLLSLDLSSYASKQGQWLRDGALGHVMVLYKQGGKYYIDRILPNGEKLTEAYKAKPLADGELRLEQPDNDFGEFYVLKKDGALQGWSENGMYLSLPKLL